MTTVSVVTGAGGAMGAACASAMAATVDVVLLTDLDPDRLGAAAERIGRETSAAICTLAGDLAEPEVVVELAARTQELGRLRSLVHTAGLSPSMAGWEDILRVDLIASARLLDGFRPAVEPGSVAVLLASIAGHMGSFEPAMDDLLAGPLEAGFASGFQSLVGDEPDPGSTYRLAKRGVLQLCERAAVSWAASGGRVVSVSPGLIDAEMGRLELRHNPIKEQMAELTPVGGGRSGTDTVLPGRTGDIADVVAFLCSDGAAFISGCDIRVDGGLTGAMNSQTTVAAPAPEPAVDRSAS